MNRSVILAMVVFLFAEALLAEEKEVAITIYNENLALVREVRELDLKRGTTEVRFTDVAAKIDPTSVHFASDGVAILEQNYEYDVVSTEKLLEKYVDREIRVVAEAGKVYEGNLLSSSDKALVLAGRGGGVTVVRLESVLNVEFPTLPEGLITRPTLVWLLDSDRGKRQRAEVSYLTLGVNWHAEYVAVVDKNDRSIEMGGWVSIDNRSGATYEDAKLKLIAGEVHRVMPPRRPRAPEYESIAIADGKGVPQFEEKAFFEYHLYTLQRRATIKDNQIKQLSLFPSTSVEVSKIFTYEGARDEKNVRVNLEFLNSEKAGLGIPLPEGKVRVYKEDEDGSLEFIGEDAIEHTPKEEKVRVYLGNAFDVVGERRRVDYRRLGERVREESYEIELRNHKSEDVEVVVVERLSGDWEIIEKNRSFRKKDAHTVEFVVPVKRESKEVVSYTVRYEW